MTLPGTWGNLSMAGYAIGLPGLNTANKNNLFLFLCWHSFGAHYYCLNSFLDVPSLQSGLVFHLNLVEGKLMRLGVANRMSSSNRNLCPKWIVDFGPIQNPTTKLSRRSWFRYKIDPLWLKDQYKDWKDQLKDRKSRLKSKIMTKTTKSTNFGYKSMER